ncbi:MAG: radical SAM protein [Azospirillaceae bacterium]
MIGDRPLGAELRVVRSAAGAHLFAADGSRLFDVPEPLADAVEAAVAAEGAPDGSADGGADAVPRPDTDALRRVVAAALDTPTGRRFVDDRPIAPPPLAAISLNVAQACNMACGYCYADEGRFGGNARLMGLDVAKASIDRLIAESEPGGRITVGFMGGEPLVNRPLVHAATAYAREAAAKAGRRVRFSLTTNATLIEPDDARLFAENDFAVSVSVDGPRALNDRLRPMRSDAGPGPASSYDRMVRGIEVLNRHGRPAHLSARITVTPRTGRLLPVLEHVLGLGFDDAGFAAVLVSPDPSLAFGPAEFDTFLGHMAECGEAAKAALMAGRRFPFTNFETALHEIHRGSHRPYPCGAGAGYLSANAEGGLYACHRLVDDPGYAFGDVHEGSDVAARADHLAAAHVDRQEPCRSCWARYLCGGGCYHEVSRRGRLGCDYIRGWLAFCLSAYAELSQARPDYFVDPARYFDGPRESALSATTVATAV